MTTMIAIAMKTEETYIGVCGLFVGFYQECQVLHAGDARAAAGRNGCVAVVTHGPVGAAVLRLAALAGAECDWQRDQAAGRTGLYRRQGGVEPAVDAVAEGHHRADREDREQGPLHPGGQRGGGGRHPHQYRGAAYEHQIELRVHEGELRSEEYRSGDHPAPPGHPAPLTRGTRQLLSTARKLYRLGGRRAARATNAANAPHLHLDPPATICCDRRPDCPHADRTRRLLDTTGRPVRGGARADAHAPLCPQDRAGVPALVAALRRVSRT